MRPFASVNLPVTIMMKSTFRQYLKYPMIDWIPTANVFIMYAHWDSMRKLRSESEMPGTPIME